VKLNKGMHTAPGSLDISLIRTVSGRECWSGEELPGPYWPKRGKAHTTRRAWLVVAFVAVAVTLRMTRPWSSDGRKGRLGIIEDVMMQTRSSELILYLLPRAPRLSSCFWICICVVLQLQLWALCAAATEVPLKSKFRIKTRVFSSAPLISKNYLLNNHASN